MKGAICALAAGAGLGLACGAAAAQGADPIDLPSGRSVIWADTVNDAQGPDGLTFRFRFLAPWIAGGALDFDPVAVDMEHLCQTFAVPRIAITGPQPSEVVIVLMDRPVDFGVADPEATQFFEAYSLQDGTCIWEPF